MSTGNSFFMLLSVIVLIGFAWTGCNREENEGSKEVTQVIEETGTIELTDKRDPNHSNLAYDDFTFEAHLLNSIRVEVMADDFTPMLKLVEVATGAILAEWDSVYSTEDALTYMIAAAGMYEARVYAMEDGTGTYSVTITITP